MAIHKKVSVEVTIVPINDMKTLRLENNPEGLVKLVGVTNLDAQFTAVLSWKDVAKILFLGFDPKKVIKNFDGSVALKEVKRVGLNLVGLQLAFLTGGGKLDWIVEFDDFVKAIEAFIE
jgi:hypothetical protein